jgi:hypothetical protein
MAFLFHVNHAQQVSDSILSVKTEIGSLDQKVVMTKICHVSQKWLNQPKMAESAKNG